MRPVLYPEYRDSRANRVEINDTVMGLVVGAHIASKVLELTDGSTRPLGELFPEIKHVRRFNMTPKDAKRILSDSERFVGQLALPAIQGVHEDLMRRSVDALKNVVPLTQHPAGRFNAKSMHDHFDALAPGHLAVDSQQVFNYVRNCRNKQIHAGGLADKEFEDDCNALVPDSISLWHRITGEKLVKYKVGDHVPLGFEHVIAALAVTKRLAESANQGLQATLPRSEWLVIIEEDWFTGPHAPQHGNLDQRERKLRGFVRMYYGPLSVTDAEVKVIAGARRTTR